MNIEINQEEKSVLTEALNSFLDDLHHEIHKTEDLRFKETLKHKKEIIQNLAKRLS